MAQYPPEIDATNGSPLQQPITLSSDGLMILVGAPGSPVVFANPDEPILTVLAGDFGRGNTWSQPT